MSAVNTPSPRKFRAPIYVPKEREGLTGVPGNMMHFTDSVLNKQKSPKPIITLPLSNLVDLSSKHNTIPSPQNSYSPANQSKSPKSNMAVTSIGFQPFTPSPSQAFRQTEGPGSRWKQLRSRMKEEERMKKFDLDGEGPDIS